LKSQAFGRAIADFARTIALNPGDIDAYHNRGSAYLGAGQTDLAIADYDRVIALAPDRARTYERRADAHLRKGNLKQAREDAERAVALAPELAEAKQMLALITVAETP
jgi:tetratricopeptide (TPR) repeat protein